MECNQNYSNYQMDLKIRLKQFLNGSEDDEPRGSADDAHGETRKKETKNRSL